MLIKLKHQLNFHSRHHLVSCFPVLPGSRVADAVCLPTKRDLCRAKWVVLHGIEPTKDGNIVRDPTGCMGIL